MTKLLQLQSEYDDSQLLSNDPLVGYIDGVLSSQECQHIINAAEGRMSRALVSVGKEGTISDGRTGSNTWLSHDSDSRVHAIAQRIADLVGLPLENAEALQVIHYGKKQEYRAHYDAYDLTSERGQRCCKRGGQRMLTALVYLNDVPTGGATGFPKLNIEVPATAGRMAIFHNCKSGTTLPHIDSLHAGQPVENGEKWAFNLWFRNEPMSQLQDFSKHAEAEQLASPQTIIDNRINRAQQLFKIALHKVDSELESLLIKPYFTYWDEYGGNKSDLSTAPTDALVFRLLDKKLINPLANKRTLAESLQLKGLQNVAPNSYIAKENALFHQPETEVWFLKNIYATAGKGMYCLRAEELACHNVPEGYIIQSMVDDLQLLEGRKFTTRIYLLIWNGQVYLYRNGFIMIHALKYDSSSTDFEVQIDHAGYHNSNSAIKMLPLQDYQQYNEYWPVIRSLSQTILPVLEPCRRASSKSRYVLLGADLLLQTGKQAKLIEINVMPNFIHTSAINNKVNIPFFTAVLRTMYGLGDDQLVAIS